MTVWQPAQVAGFARAARWRGDELVTAVAVALAGSRGDDAIDTGAGFDGRPTLRGLWLIPFDDLAEWPPGSLYDPETNAVVAHHLWRINGGWDWHPAYTSGQWEWMVPAALDGIQSGGKAALTGSAGYDDRGFAASVRRATDTATLITHRLAGLAGRIRSNT